MNTMTPEGKVKQAITKFLKEQESCWWVMPVVSGYGKPLLDYIGCSRGRFFAIEAKAPGRKPTARQVRTLTEIERAAGMCFVVDNVQMSELMVKWFNHD